MRPRSAERVGLWNANSDAFRVSCYDGSIGQVILVVDRNMVNCFSHLSRSEAGQPDDAMMGHSFENGELAKILIQFDEVFSNECARSRIAASPGSCSHEPDQSTSCPSSKRTGKAPPQTQLSSKIDAIRTLMQWEKVRFFRGVLDATHTRGKHVCPQVQAMDIP